MQLSHRDELIAKLIARPRVNNVSAFNTYSSNLRFRTNAMSAGCIAKPTHIIRYSLVSNSKEDILASIHQAMSKLKPNTRWYCAFEAPTEYNYPEKVLKDIELLTVEVITWMLDMAHLLKLTVVLHGIIPKEIESVVKLFEDTYSQEILRDNKC